MIASETVRLFIEEHYYTFCNLFFFLFIFSIASIIYRCLIGHILNYDKLTGFRTQKSFEKDASKLLENKNRNYVILKYDISNFKFLNQIYGKKGADKIIKWLASAIHNFSWQREEKPKNGIVARVYADQFYGMFEITSRETFFKVFDEIVGDYTRLLEDQNRNIVIKIGIAFTGKDYGYDSITSLIDKANYAQQSIRESNVQHYIVFDKALSLQFENECRICSHITKAFNGNELFVVYQPKIDLKTGEVTGAEALVRWRSPEMGMLLPGEFISAFEKYGCIKKTDFYVLRKVLAYLQNRLEKGLPVVPVSINMSRVHFYDDTFTSNFLSVVSEYNVPPSLIEIEILERSFTFKGEILKKITGELQSMGYLFAIDDFGTGESALNMLVSIPAQTIKIDRSFLTSLDGESEDSVKVLSKILEMTKAIGKKVVCEGAETVEQVDFLKSVNCDQVQGFYYSKPLTGTEFSDYLNSHNTADSWVDK